MKKKVFSDKEIENIISQLGDNIFYLEGSKLGKVIDDYLERLC